MHANVIRIERRPAPGVALEVHELEHAADALPILERGLRGRNDHIIAAQTGLSYLTVRAYRLGLRKNPALETGIRLLRAIGYAVRAVG